jgi:hypothetical protein
MFILFLIILSRNDRDSVTTHSVRSDFTGLTEAPLITCTHIVAIVIIKISTRKNIINEIFNLS